MTTSSDTFTILDPTVESITTSATLATRSKDLDGLTLGLLGNGRPNAVALLDAVYSILEEHYHFKKVIRVNKSDASRPAPEPMIEDIIKRCDLIITGVGD